MVAALAISCNSSTSTDSSKEETSKEETSQDENALVFGEDFTPENPVPSTKVLAMEGLNSPVVLEAEVKAVCQNSGCWLDVPLSEGEDMKVTFKDYGFFVPKDMAGEKVYIKGDISLDTLSVDYLRHMAEDAGKDSTEIASITEEEVKLTMVATGVRRVE